MRPTSVTVSSQTTSPVIPVNWRADTFRVSVACVISAGANLTYSVQHTFDDVFDPSVTPSWFDHLTLVDKITSGDGSYMSPVIAIRLNVTAHTGGSVTMTLVSSGG